MLFPAVRGEIEFPGGLDRFDRIVILYLTFPLPIFLCGWLRFWAALPLVLCLLYALRLLRRAGPAVGVAPPISAMQWILACAVGTAWTFQIPFGFFA